MVGRFELEPVGTPYSGAAIRIAVCKCTWIALSTVRFGIYVFCATILLFQLTPPFRFTLDAVCHRASRAWLYEHSFLLAGELGLIGLVAFLTFLVPTLIMTWITALVMQHLLGWGLFRRRQGLTQEGVLIAKDMTWLAIKSIVKKGNIGALVVLIIALSINGFNRKAGDVESGCLS